MNVKLTKIEKLVNALADGDELSVKQIRHRFRLASPTSAVAKLRNRGYNIQLHQVGRVKKYSMEY
jgi:hypothetical protein